MIKYLYGKSCNLDVFANTGKGLWFRDLFTMDRLDNERIKDNEACKSIKVLSGEIKEISVARRSFCPALGTSFTASIKPQRCHVLCLSDKGNDTELFDLFNADICIAIDVVRMEGMLKNANKEDLKVVGGKVNYYDSSRDVLNCKAEEAVFLKPADPYITEAEYRIAIFWPFGERSKVKTTEVGYINVFNENSSSDDHVTFSFQCPEFDEVVVGVTRI